MSSENRSKINQLLQKWPAGTVAVLPWLAEQGVYQQLAYEYECAGWLRRVGRGAYARLNESINWQGGIYAIQHQLNYKIHVGGKTALDLKGFMHFVPAGEGAEVFLFGEAGERPPAWFMQHDWKRQVVYKMPNLFGSKSGGNLGLTSHSLTTFEITVSTPERAVMELLHLVPHEQSVEEAMLLMEGLATLRPKLVQELLEQCRSIKVKRLFLAMAERFNHPWLKKVELKKVKLGKGKRAITSGGVLDPKYYITLPRPERKEADDGDIT